MYDLSLFLSVFLVIRCHSCEQFLFSFWFASFFPFHFFPDPLKMAIFSANASFWYNLLHLSHINVFTVISKFGPTLHNRQKKNSTKSKMIVALMNRERERGTSQSEWEKVELRECKTGILLIIRRPIQIQQPFIQIIWIQLSERLFELIFHSFVVCAFSYSVHSKVLIY